ncbi:protein-L-isoaspartate(D-aspartate) O-methyltransferase [Roseimaritima sediminicola]|uniref:protein-L-isoaspartate(D-aspartate) O-methyltransferase n=1 Tax=Roseimaritima sediminicola TaxID=2662066 RepID=UPI0012983033|nr:protein-L-isoaspartate(D-aspartate) O-methyltransferase [Roseimaritima sediminicola]
MSAFQEPSSAAQRRQLIRQLEQQVDDPAVLQALEQVPREAFVSEDLREEAYANTALPIGHRQTISQPYIVALMASALQLSPDDRVLEVGTGSGYAAAVLSHLAAAVYTVERLGELASAAAECLQRGGYDNVYVHHGDGTRGWPDHAPYDAISVAAASAQIPSALLDQLAEGGRLVIPLGAEAAPQHLVRILKRGPEDYERENLGGVRFVPLIGDA